MLRTGVIVVRNLSMTALPSKRMPWPRCAHVSARDRRASEAHDAVARLVRAGSAQHREPPVLAGRAVTTGMDDHGSERLGDQEHG